MAQTLYWVVAPSASASYANDDTDAAKIVAGQNASGGALAAGTYGSQAYVSGTPIDASSPPTSQLSPGTAYKIAWTIYDGVSVYGGGTSTKTVVSAEFTTHGAVTPAIIASTTVGSHTVARTAVAAVTPALIASTATFGTHTVSSGAVAAITATRIESTASFGTATVTRTALAAVTPDRIESTASFGTHVVSAEGVALIAPSIIASTTTFGTPVVSYIRVEAVSAPRIESTASFGAHTVARQAVAAITPGRIDSAASFGVPVVTSSATAQIVVERIESTVTFGTATVARTGSGSADPADVWSYVLSNGLTAEQNLVAVYEWLNELHLIHGLRAGSPMMVTPTQRTAASIVQEIAEAGSDVTVTRQ